MKQEHFDLGLIGLGVMGRNFLLNVAEHGFAVVGYDLDAEKVRRVRDERGSGHDVDATAGLDDFVGSLRRPRAVMLLVPAGQAVDAVLNDLAPRLDAGDVVIDGGNSHFRDTNRRAMSLKQQGVQFLGVGVSGGELGARHGPSIMPGGDPEAYVRVEEIFTAVAARVRDEPCVALLGRGSAGHYVKMVHNGIEYGTMQLIAEVYDTMKRGLELSPESMRDAFLRWNDGPLKSYLVEITAAILGRHDDRTGQPLLDVIADAARQKGTGKWTSQDAMELQVPVPVLDAAVMARNLSALDEQRCRAAAHHPAAPGPWPAGDSREWVQRLHDALHAGMLLTYAQGMALIRRASDEYDYGIEPATVASIWRGGCIIRAALLDDIRTLLDEHRTVENLLLVKSFVARVAAAEDNLRRTVAATTRAGVPVPAMGAALAYLDGYRRARLPTNLIQAQRDYFGSHTYERVDDAGAFHTEWPY